MLWYIGLGLEKYSNYITAAGLTLDISDLDLNSALATLLELHWFYDIGSGLKETLSLPYSTRIDFVKS